MSDPDGLSPGRIEQIRQKLEVVQAALRDGELCLFNKAHHATWEDIEDLLAEVTAQAATIAQLRQRLSKIRDFASTVSVMGPSDVDQILEMADLEPSTRQKAEKPR